MIDLLAWAYPFIKTVHILAVISWMAGLLYLPRLFVNHVENSKFGDEKDILLRSMERKLLKVIMTPAMMVTWIFGILLICVPGIVDFGSVWIWVKLLCVFVLSGFHGFLSKSVKRFESGENKFSGKQWRLLNEVPTILMVIIVASVVFKY